MSSKNYEVSSMKLIYIANARLPTEKAHGAQVMNMCGAFARAGAHVTLLVPRRWGNRIVAEPFHYYGLLKNFKLVKLPCIDFVWTEMKWAFFLEELTFMISWRLYLLLHQKDVVYARDPFVPFLGWSIWAKIVFEAHTKPMRMLFRRKIFLVRVHNVVAMTSFIRDRYLAWGMRQERILIAPDAVDTALFAELRRQRSDFRGQMNVERRKVISYVGQLHTMGMEKGIRNLLMAFAKIFMAHNDATLFIVGGPHTHVAGYRALAHELGIDGRVRFVDQVPPRSAACYEVISDVLVAPSPKTDFFMYDASPMKIFEYRATGRPIVVSDMPAMREAVGDYPNAIFVEPENPDALARGLVTALDMGQVVDESIPTWDDRARAVLDFIK